MAGFFAVLVVDHLFQASKRKIDVNQKLDVNGLGNRLSCEHTMNSYRKPVNVMNYILFLLFTPG